MYNLQEILAPKKAQTVIRFKDLLLALECYNKEFSRNINNKSCSSQKVSKKIIFRQIFKIFGGYVDNFADLKFIP